MTIRTIRTIIMQNDLLKPSWVRSLTDLTSTNIINTNEGTNELCLSDNWRVPGTNK